MAKKKKIVKKAEATDTKKRVYTKKSVVSHAKKITATEARKFNELDLEIRNDLLSIKTTNFEIELIEREKQDKLVELENSYKVRIDQHKNFLARVEKSLNPKSEVYTNFIQKLANKYGFNLERLAVDPKTRIIRELPNNEEES